MRNARPIDSPTDPFNAVPLPESATIRRPRIEGLPAGVLPEMLADPVVEQPQAVKLPPVAQPPQPWPIAREQISEPPPPPAPVFGLARPRPAPEAARHEGPRRRRFPFTLMVAVAVLLALVYLVPAILMSGSVLPGTTVAGVDIGGLTVTQAADKIRTELKTTIERPITVDLGGERKTLQPETAGLEFNVVATIKQAQSGFPTPLEVWRSMTGATQLQPQITVNAAQLARTIESLAQSVDQRPREGHIAYRGLRPIPTLPEDGVLLDRDAAVQLLQAAFTGSSGYVTLPTRVVQPGTTRQQVTDGMAVARRAVSAPIVLRHGTRSTTLTPAMIAGQLTFGPDGKGGFGPSFDTRGGSVEALDRALIDAAQATQDATYELVNDRLVPVRAKVGVGIDLDKLGKDVAEVVAGGGSRTIEVQLARMRPRITDAELAGLGIEEKIGEYTSGYACCLARVTNIHRMAEQLDGYVVKPGETFSLNEVIGDRTPAAGYVAAPQYAEGKVSTAVGGGVSQTATTLLNAAFRGGLEIVEQHPFDLYMPPYPPGLDTMLTGELDLRWRNDSDYGVLIKTDVSETSVTVSLWSTARYDRVEVLTSQPRDVVAFDREVGTGAGCVPVDGQQGFTVDVVRVFHADGKEVGRDTKQTTQYRPRSQVTCSPTG
ncbi:VanW family protein [Nonomuraea sp. NPDC050663]|uniref:VanW family protein n=1 Tax=Nonomuraea sp. NPDC050663 TaxID=3364370 RepID=UPI0037B1D3DB